MEALVDYSDSDESCESGQGREDDGSTATGSSPPMAKRPKLTDKHHQGHDTCDNNTLSLPPEILGMFTEGDQIYIRPLLVATDQYSLM